MSDSSNLPIGAEFDSSAPYNEKSQPYKEVEVTISLSISKTVKVYVADYKTYAGTDDEGNNFIYDDFSKCDLKKAVREQVYLPHQVFDKLYQHVYKSDEMNMNKAIDAVNSLKDWNEDDFEVILE